MGLAYKSGSTPVPAELFELFPVLKQMLNRRGGDLSGGQQQQLAIARALAAGPKLLILDEPTEGIQPSIIKDIGRVIRMLADRKTMAIVLVEQYYDFAAELADQYLRDGARRDRPARARQGHGRGRRARADVDLSGRSRSGRRAQLRGRRGRRRTRPPAPWRRSASRLPGTGTSSQSAFCASVTGCRRRRPWCPPSSCAAGRLPPSTSIESLPVAGCGLLVAHRGERRRHGGDVGARRSQVHVRRRSR